MEQKRITLLMVRGKSKLEFANKLEDGWTGGIKNERDSAISYIKSSSISSFSTIKSLTESFMENGCIKSPPFLRCFCFN
jgi:hypothetical protein